MDSAGVVSEAVRVMTTLAGGASAAVGTEIGQAVSDLLRQRLGASPSGQAALTVVDARPEDPAAVAELRQAVQACVAADPHFVALLAAALAGPSPADPPGPPRQYTHSVVIDGGSRVKRNTISLGPVTINNTASGRVALVALSAGLVVLVALAVYGGTQVFSSQDSPGSGGDARTTVQQGRTSGGQASGGQTSGGQTSGGQTSGGRTGSDAGAPPDAGAAKMAPLADAEAVKEVLPDLTSLPAGWTESSTPTADVSSQDDGSTFEGRSEYLGRYSMETSFAALAYPSEDKARAAFAANRTKALAQTGAQAMTMPSYGDETVAFSVSESQGEGYVTHTTEYTMVRTGTVITVVGGKDNESRSYDSGDLESLTRLLSERARTAQSH